MPRKKPESSETPSLEATMKQLEGIVEDLESDDIPRRVRPDRVLPAWVALPDRLQEAGLVLDGAPCAGLNGTGGRE